MKIRTFELQKLFDLMEEKDLTILEVIALIQEKNEAVEVRPIVKEFDLIVDYSRTVQEMVNAGNYGCTNSNIMEQHFRPPIKLKGKKVPVFTRLFYFNSAINSEDAIAEMDKVGYGPATLPEILALGESHPELQKEFPIVVLGSVWRDEGDICHVPVLYFADGSRKLGLYWFNNVWLDFFLFLGVRK